MSLDSTIDAIFMRRSAATVQITLDSFLEHTNMHSDKTFIIRFNVIILISCMKPKCNKNFGVVFNNMHKYL